MKPTPLTDEQLMSLGYNSGDPDGLLGFAENVVSARDAQWQEMLAKYMHYPDCWDTAAYPTLESAMHENSAWFKCSNQDTHAAPVVQDDNLTIAYMAGFDAGKAKAAPVVQDPVYTREQHYALLDKAVENVRQECLVKTVTMRCNGFDVALNVIDAYSGHILVAECAAPKPAQKDAVEWAVAKWMAEVRHRPLVNVHRRSLDDTWRTVIRHFGGDDSKLLPLKKHDDLMAAAPQPAQDVPEVGFGNIKAEPVNQMLLDALKKIEGSSMSMYATYSDAFEHQQDIARAAITSIESELK